MRRAPSLSVTKGRFLTQAKDDDNDIALGVGNEMKPDLENSPTAKSKVNKHGLTVFGLKPSPELLSISMGERNPLQCHRQHSWFTICRHLLVLQCTLCKAYSDLHD